MTEESGPGKAAQGSAEAHELDPQMIERIKALRERLHSVFAQVTLALTATPRYRHHTIAELQHLVPEPLIRDRIAVASPPHREGEPEPPMAGVAFRAKASPQADAKIREQIKAGLYPVRLKAEDRDSGEIAWLLDVITPTREQAGAVVKSFAERQGEGKLFVHPGVRGALLSQEATNAAHKSDGRKPEAQGI